MDTGSLTCATILRPWPTTWHCCTTVSDPTSCYGDRQPLTSPPDNVLCLTRTARARFLSDTTHCPWRRQSLCATRQCAWNISRHFAVQSSRDWPLLCKTLNLFPQTVKFWIEAFSVCCAYGGETNTERRVCTNVDSEKLKKSLTQHVAPRSRTLDHRIDILTVPQPTGHEVRQSFPLCNINMGETGSKFASWKVRNRIQNHVYCFVKEIIFWLLKSGCSLKSPIHALSIIVQLLARRWKE